MTDNAKDDTKGIHNRVARAYAKLVKSGRIRSEAARSGPKKKRTRPKPEAAYVPIHRLD